MDKKNILRYSIKWFVLIIFASILLWQLVFGALTAPQKHETIEFFVTGDICDTNLFQKTIRDGTNAKKVNVYAYSIKDTYYSVTFATNGLLNSDLLILPAKYFDDDTTALNFAPLTEQILQKYGIDAERFSFVECAGENYAVSVFDKAKKVNLFKDALKYTEEDNKYCLAVSVNRPNAAPYSKQEVTSDNAFYALAAILNGDYR